MPVCLKDVYNLSSEIVHFWIPCWDGESGGSWERHVDALNSLSIGDWISSDPERPVRVSTIRGTISLWDLDWKIYADCPVEGQRIVYRIEGAPTRQHSPIFGKPIWDVSMAVTPDGDLTFHRASDEFAKALSDRLVTRCIDGTQPTSPNKSTEEPLDNMLLARPGSVCRRCSDSGRIGLLGPSGLGLATKACPDCEFLESTLNERDVLWELRDRHCNLEFLPESEETVAQLKDIWEVAFPEEPLDSLYCKGEWELCSESWKRLGFQSANPRTDVRTGRFVLDQLHYLAVMHPLTLRRLAKDAEEYEYFLAISCFNLSHTILVFFRLVSSSTVSPLSGAKIATREQLLHFLGLCSRAPHSPATVLNELFVALVQRLNSTWKLMHHLREHCNVMQHFQEALLSVFEANAAFWKEPVAMMEDFQIVLALPPSDV